MEGHRVINVQTPHWYTLPCAHDSVLAFSIFLPSRFGPVLFFAKKTRHTRQHVSFVKLTCHRQRGQSDQRHVDKSAL